MKSSVVRKSSAVLLSLATCVAFGCSSSPTSSGGAGASGGELASGGAVENGGSIATGGSVTSSGAASVAGAQGRSGATGQGGAVQSSGGAQAAGGAQATAGNTSANGGATQTGGASATGGAGGAVSIFDGKTLTGWSLAHNANANAFSVNVADGAIASTGGVRASLYYSASKYTSYRVIYSVRQVVRKDHDPGVLFYGTKPTEDVLWGLMFALPHHWGWDYRNGVSKILNTQSPNAPNLDLTKWARCELLFNAATGTAKAACAQPVDAKAMPMISFTDPTIPNVPSYFGILCHTGGEVDEYKDITLEPNPTVNDLITTK